ncbi:MAG: hypothetical protein ACJARD_000686 [Alphaproteobacteria bacterium]|jgi:uncharacterized protein (DUF2141 family)
MHKTILAIAFINVAFLTSQAFSANLTVNIDNITSNQGHIECALFDENHAKAFPTKPKQAILTQRQIVSQKNLICQFDGLNAGTYALSVYHDVNDSGDIDTNFIGIPNEPMGATNNPKGFFGPPSFSDAAIKLDKNQIVTVTLQ